MEEDGEGGAEEFRWVQTVSLRGQLAHVIKLQLRLHEQKLRGLY